MSAILDLPVAVWKSELGGLEVACRETAHRWAARWAEKLRRALADAGAAESDVSGRRKRKADEGSAAACFRLGRFPRFLDAEVERAAEILEEAEEAILADVSACAGSFVSKQRRRGSFIMIAQPLIDSLERVAAG